MITARDSDKSEPRVKLFDLLLSSVQLQTKQQAQISRNHRNHKAGDHNFPGIIQEKLKETTREAVVKTFVSLVR